MSDKIYGIDLGTTNSLIGVDGKLITGLVSSKVDFNIERSVEHNIVGDNILGSYKIDMGLGAEGETPIKASSIVLKELCRLVKEYTGDDVEKVIISVPAYFSNNQRMAVRKACELIGLELVNIINEPTAAALYICNKEFNNLKRGIFIVYDLGGGTFDTTIIDSRSGKYIVVATDGCILGGDDLDNAIAKFILDKLKVPIFKRNSNNTNALIAVCEKAKRFMQESYRCFKLDNTKYIIELPECFKIKGSYEFSLGEYKELVRNVFGKTISILHNIINNKLPKGTDYNIVFVGGSTHDAYLCSWVLEQADIPFDKAEFDTSPDFTVAMGVCKYANAIQNGELELTPIDVTKQLSISDNKGQAIVIIKDNTTIPCTKTKMVENSEYTDELRLYLYQGNSKVAKDNECIGSLCYNYGRFVETGEGVVDVKISVDTSGFITLEVTDLITFKSTSVTLEKGVLC